MDEQIADSRADCEQLGWRVVNEHSDSSISASRFAGGKTRPGWEAVKRDIISGWADGVVLWEPSRGSRELTDWSQFLSLCRSKGTLIRIVTHGRTYDPRIPRDWRTLAEDGVDSAYETEKNSERVRRGVHGALAAGKPTASIPFGYAKVRDVNNGRVTGLEIDPADAAIVRQLFADVLAGQPVSHAAGRTDMTRQKALWILRNPAYIGQRKLADGTYVPVQWEPILAEETFWRARSILDGHRGANLRPGAVRWLLSHLAVCGKCGRQITVEKKKEKGDQISYRCIKGCVLYADAEDADQRVMWAVLEWLQDPENLQRYVPADGGEAEAAEVAQLEARIEDAKASYAQGKIPIGVLESVVGQVQPQLVVAQERARRAVVPPALISFLDGMARYQTAYEIWHEMPLAAQRDVIRACAKVTILPSRTPRQKPALGTDGYRIQVELL